MVPDQKVADQGADNTNPYQHVICIDSNIVPLSVDPAPNLSHVGLELTSPQSGDKNKTYCCFTIYRYIIASLGKQQ